MVLLGWPMDRPPSTAEPRATALLLLPAPSPLPSSVPLTLPPLACRPLDLMFGLFETGITFLSALIVSGVVADGETNWLEGSMLLFSYVIVCMAFFFYNSDI